MKIKIISIFLFMLMLAGCSANSVVADIPVPGSELKFRLIKGSADFLNDKSLNLASFITYIPVDTTGKAYPNPFSPGFSLGIKVNSTQIVKIDIYKNRETFLHRIFDAELEEGNYSLMLLKTNVPSGSYVIRVEQGDKEYFYSMAFR